MKHIFFLSIIASCLNLGAFGATPQHTITGHLVDGKSNNVAFANVVITNQGAQIAGAASDSEGKFTIMSPEGDYDFSVQYIGYKPYTKRVACYKNIDMGTITLDTDQTQIGEVVVKAQLIRREADRFVVDIANSPSAIGKNGIELLQQSPGVWVTDDDISINGRSGTKIYVNDRELKLDTEQAINYIKGLRAEEVRKIEVIPISGADYDADSASGIIKITLKKRRENGIDGNVSYNYTTGKYGSSQQPSANINYHNGKMDLSASGWYNDSKNDTYINEMTDYTTTPTTLESNSHIKDKYVMGGAKIGVVYQFNDKHSIGGEANYWIYSNDALVSSQSNLMNASSPNLATTSNSKFDNANNNKSLSTTLNYIYKLDTLGSTFKVIGDYIHRSTDGNNFNQSITNEAGVQRDSLYRDNSNMGYNIVTATAALEKKYRSGWSLKSGLKFTNNSMKSDAIYEYQKAENWIKNEDQSYDIDYSENIAAVYGIVNGRFGRFMLMAGLRGEYTNASSQRAKDIDQSYFSLFPNANLTWMVTKDGSSTMTGQYSRSISRPGFWALNPSRRQISDYTYSIGNPYLKPSFTNNISLTTTLKYKYSLTLGIMSSRDRINQIIESDPDDPNVVRQTQANVSSEDYYYAAINAPMQIKKWWSANVNLNYTFCDQQIYPDQPSTTLNMFRANASTTFILPKKFFIDLSYYYSTKSMMGTAQISSMNILNCGVKKKLLKDKLTFSFTVQNILQLPFTVTTTLKDFTRTMHIDQNWSARRFNFGVTYNFNSGKKFNARQVESGSSDERSRLGEQ